jgi:hypothetical protein
MPVPESLLASLLSLLHLAQNNDIIELFIGRDYASNGQNGISVYRLILRD